MRQVLSRFVMSVVLVTLGVSTPGCHDHQEATPAGDDQQAKARSTTPRIRLPVPTEAPVVRVRLRRIVGDLEPVEFAHSGQSVTIRDANGNQIDRTGPLTVRRDGDGWLIRASDGSTMPRSMQNAPWVSLEASGDAALEMKDDSDETRRYVGAIRCVHVPETREVTWEAIEHVPIEDYLPGVLAGELYGHWGRQCQAAQAIAARSFVSMECHMRASRRWDVIDTAGSQAYLGAVDDPVGHAATEMTRGMVLTWGAELVPGYFSSCCGGRASPATEAIGPNPINAIKPLDGHTGDGYCQSAPLYQWTRKCDGRALGSAIRAAAPRDSDLSSLGTITRIDITGRNQHGRGVTLQLTDASGRKATIGAERLLQQARDLPGGPLYSGWVEGRTRNGQLELTGHGYGHGAGLCQYGAAAMDKAGKSFWQMIEYFYPGAEVKKAW